MDTFKKGQNMSNSDIQGSNPEGIKPFQACYPSINLLYPRWILCCCSWKKIRQVKTYLHKIVIMILLNVENCVDFNNFILNSSTDSFSRHGKIT